MSHSSLELGSPAEHPRALQAAIRDLVEDNGSLDTFRAAVGVGSDGVGMRSLIEQRRMEAARQPETTTWLTPTTELGAVQMVVQIIGVYFIGFLVGLGVSEALDGIGESFALGTWFEVVESVASTVALVLFPLAYLRFLWQHRDGAPRQPATGPLRRIDDHLDDALRIQGLAIPEDVDRAPFLDRLQRAARRLDLAMEARDQALQRLEAQIRAERRVGQLLRGSGAQVVAHGVRVGPNDHVDHVLLGPYAVVVETRPGRGTISAGEPTGEQDALVLLDGRPLPDAPSRRAVRGAAAIAATLGVPAIPVVCITDASGGPARVGRTMVCNAEQLRLVLRSAPAVLAGRDVDELASAVPLQATGNVDVREAGLGDGHLAAITEARQLLRRLQGGAPGAAIRPSAQPTW